MALLTGFVLIAAMATWILPAGEFQRVVDPETSAERVVAGTFERVAPNPLGPFETLVAIPAGLESAAGVIVFILLVGGAFFVVEQTGALAGGITWLLGRSRGRPAVPIALVSLAFATGGALSNTQEEIIAVMPVLLLLARRLGCDPVTATAISLAPAGVGSAFSPVNPFQALLAQRTAEMQLLSGAAFRLVFLAIAVAISVAWALRHAARARADTADDLAAIDDTRISRRHAIILALFGGSFAIFVYGIVALEWDYDRMTALLFGMGIVAGMIGGLGIDGMARAFAEGFKVMAPAAVTVGLARAVFVVLEQGRIVDTIVNGAFTPLEALPATVSAVGMLGAHAALHVPVSSVSGQAVLTMPIAAPLADLLGLSRQVAVLAYQYGAGLTDLVTPTNGSMMAVIATAGVRYDEWLRFAFPLWVMLSGLGVIAIVTAVALGI
jgi:uncharacterized ion transporter superfamily protein YfcC